MPFAMTHLYIAHNIIKSTPQIKKPGDFMLGAVAPDAVHFLDNYHSDLKKISHLCIGDEKWGNITNNQEWLSHVLNFLKIYNFGEKKDFIYGYCSHIITDLQNNIKIWTPFLAENKDAIEKGMGSIYHQESFDIDYELYLISPEQQRDIWELLRGAAGYNIENVIGRGEIDKMKHHLLYNLFNDRKPAEVSTNKYVTISRVLQFISAESQYISRLLYDV